MHYVCTKFVFLTENKNGPTMFLFIKLYHYETVENTIKFIVLMSARYSFIPFFPFFLINQPRGRNS